MSTNKRFAELADKSDADLRTELKSVQRALYGLRVGLANQSTENTSGVHKLRRDVARIKTLLTQRQHNLTKEVAAK